MGLKYLCLCFFLSVLKLQGQEFRFHPGDSLNPGNGFLEVTALPPGCRNSVPDHPPDWKSILKVFPKTLRLENKQELPAMLGAYLFADTALFFQPRFPFREQQEYIVEFACTPKDVVKTAVFSVPASSMQTLVFLDTLFPSTTQVPANLFKMYLYFSAPMGPGDVYAHIHLFDADGTEVENPFLQLEPALWDRRRQRLTLWFDPGRIKSELQPNLSRGKPLQEGKCYKLLISSNLRDAFGQPLARDFEKKICTVAEDHTRPAPADWKVISPKAFTSGRLNILFPEKMDKAGLENGITVLDPFGKPVAGTVMISNQETEWTFVPENPWIEGEYQFLPDPRMEDLAGNNLMRLFDSPVQANAAKTPGQTEFMIRFRVKK